MNLSKPRLGGHLTLRSKRIRDGQRGGAKLSFAITIIILGIMVFCAIKVVPSWFANYQLQDAMTTEARFATSTYPKKTLDDIRDDVYKKVQELGVPAKKDDIKVTSDGSQVTISLDYAVTYDLAVTQITHQFHLYADSRSI
jgi:Flp pilus assembly protein TadG